MSFVTAAASRAVHPDSPKPSPSSDSDEDNLIGIQGLDRFREPDSCLAEYCTESLYSYSFTPLSRVNKAKQIKRHLMNRGMDYMQRIRYPREPSRRFSQPDMGILDMQEWNPDLKVSPSVNDLVNHHPMDREEFPTGRRQTIEVLPRTHLHTPSRFLPQNQAILTTDSEGRVLLFNAVASLCFGMDTTFVGQSILCLLDDSVRQQIQNLLQRRQNDGRERVLICGAVVAIQKKTGQAAASLWLKEKLMEDGKRIYIWIFEEIYETSWTVQLDENNEVVQVSPTIQDLFGYQPEEVSRIQDLLPALLTGMGKIGFYGARSSQGVMFPTMVSRTDHTYKIVSLPSIAGLITVHGETGKIQSVNPVPAKYLFGYSSDRLEKTDIRAIIPQFPAIVARLRECSLLQSVCTVNNHACRWVLSDSSLADLYHSMDTAASLKSIERRPSVNSQGQALPVIYAVHRDGSHFEIQIQLRLVESEGEGLISVWVTYDRIQAMKRKQSKTEKSTAQRPPIKFYGLSFFGSGKSKQTSLSTSPPPEPVIQAKPSPMDDYVVVSTLGEGAYGTAKLAYRKDDPSMTKMVIKCIAKSRIVVDSWIRDRKLGLIPLEIHILKKLKDNPQPNCCSIDSYMEDEDYYFAIMELHGERSLDLFDYIELNEKANETAIKKIFLQISKAVEHIHRLNIVHRDIKDENILLDETGCVHLIDFGSAAYFREGRKFDTFGGTLDYCAPEILKGMSYEGPPQDIWSLGTLLYTMIYRENPFYNVDEILEHDLRVPYVLSEDSLDLIQHMLNRDVKDRYTIDQVLSHPWFNI
ncbi:kinase-like domain-containing protein [Sporodiniella umbellata]|nr:kinase-like domain-containing protein [Sporodiniella umbellata]